MIYWALPALIAGVGLIAAVVLGFRAAEEFSALRRQVRYMAELRPALAEVRTASQALADNLRRPRRP